MKSGIVLAILFLCYPLCIKSQGKVQINFKKSSISLVELFDIVENQSNYFFVYNPELIPLEAKIELKENSYNLIELVSLLQEKLSLEITFDNSNFKLLVSNLNEFSISGFLLDSISSESLIGAIILSDKKMLGTTNYNGYFNIRIDSSITFLDFYNIAYKTKRYRIDRSNLDDLVIYMKPRLNLNIVITPEAENLRSDYERISTHDIQDHYGTSGVNDLIQTIKFGTGVSPGAEAQNGFTTRGGGPHQNLILIDGLPIYEASHLGGLSSIFLASSIKSIDFHKSSFPARYGGRISSVLDVRLKDGNRNKYSREFAVGLEGVTLHLDGPLSGKTSFNINARASWFSRLAEPILKHYTDVDELKLKYNDTYAKITHWFSPSSKLSLSAYLGDDLVKLVRDNQNGSNTGFQDLNRISWGNKFLSLKWEKLISKKLYFQVNLGRSSYDYRSRGSYKLTFIESDTLTNNSFDILSLSKLIDNVINIELDYYSKNIGQFKLGLNSSFNSNNPSITESEIFAQELVDPVAIDTNYNSREFMLFLENDYFFSKKIKLSSGFRINSYFIDESSYFYFEPRINVQFFGKRNSLSLSYSRMSQFIHLLSNPGPGLPSDLWVPSTSSVSPEISNSLSLDYSYLGAKIKMKYSLWYKNFQNLIEYSNSADIIYSLIIDNELYQVEVDNSNWEDRISFGKGRAYGFEFDVETTISKFDFKLNYSFSRSYREFSSIDSGEYFPYKFDTPNAVSSQIKYQIDDSKTLLINWQYATGTAYTLSDTEFLGTDGQPVLVPSSRNNFRLPAYHHLDIHYRLKKDYLEGKLVLDIGLYNVYNRLNAFYTYLSQNSESGTPELVNISLYPILPQFNLAYHW